MLRRFQQCVVFVLLSIGYAQAVDISTEVAILRGSQPLERQSTSQEAPTNAVLLTPQVTSLREKLEQTHEFDFQETTLRQVCDWVSETFDIHVHVNHLAIADANVEMSDTISFTAQDISLRNALKLILRQLEMQYLVSDAGIHLTSDEWAQESYTARVYPIADLLSHDNFHPIMNNITAMIEPDSWNDVGGPGSWSRYRSAVVISQSNEVHESIEQFLQALRKLATMPDNKVFSFDPNETDAARNISAALKKTVSCEFASKPLGEVVAFFQSQIGCPMSIDENALLDLGMSSRSVKVTCNYNDVPGEDALSLLLADHGLAFTVQHAALSVTSQDVLDETLTNKIYHCGPLLSATHTRIGRELELKHIISTIETQVTPNDWDHVGGPFAAQAYVHGNAVLVSATRPAHAEIDSLLTILSNVKPLAEKLQARHATVKVYSLSEPFHGEKAKDLAEFVTELMAGSKNAILPGQENQFVRAIGNKLVFSHQAKLHEPLESILAKLGAIHAKEAEPEFSEETGSGGSEMGGRMSGMGSGMGGGMF